MWHLGWSVPQRCSDSTMDRDETKQTSIFRLEGDCEVVLKCEPFHRKLRYLISTLRVWVINVVESIFINLPNQACSPMPTRQLGFPLQFRLYKSKVRSRNSYILHISGVILKYNNKATHLDME